MTLGLKTLDFRTASYRRQFLPRLALLLISGRHRPPTSRTTSWHEHVNTAGWADSPSMQLNKSMSRQSIRLKYKVIDALLHGNVGDLGSNTGNLDNLATRSVSPWMHAVVTGTHA